MASGYGLTGGPSRCFPFWQELLGCYVVNANPENPKQKERCVPALEDYYECLHHKKEAAKTTAIQTAFRAAQEKNPDPNPPRPGDVRSLGLLNKEAETKALLTRNDK